MCRTRRDALAARGVQQADRRAFPVRHRQDDGFLTLDHRINDSRGGNLFLHLAKTRQHSHDPAKAAHFLKLAKLGKEIVHVELTLGHPLGETLGFFGLDVFRRLLDKRHDVAHVEDPTRHARRIEFLEGILFLADTDKLDRTAGNLAHRQRRAAARVTIKASQHDTGDVDSLVEGGRRGHGVLTGHRVGDQQYLVRIGQRLHLAKLGHQPFINGDPAGGIEDQDVEPLELGRLQGTLGDLREVIRGRLPAGRPRPVRRECEAVRARPGGSRQARPA